MKAKTRNSQKKSTANSGTATNKTKPKNLKIKPSAKSSAALAQSSLFEITPEEVFKLDDKQLRELVARNAKAKFAAKGFPTEFVTWGGEQRAPDGGVDVRVTSTQEIADAAAFQARIVGYQVKATKMPPSEILKEMRPGGVLKLSIDEILRDGGAYLIVSNESNADSEHRRRVAAMRAAVAGVAGVERGHVDFYDARRIADWTNEHPSVVAWVRATVGPALQGWRPFGTWANTRKGKKQQFLDDTSERFFDPLVPDKKYSLSEGVQKVRASLRAGGVSVRIAGLSGVGKTRFAQALFEEESLAGALPSDLAVYTDTSDSPDPTPVALIDELLSARRRAILLIDNCPAALHNQLTARIKASKAISLLTIEYDIQDDSNDETQFFRLAAGSRELIEALIKQQFPEISGVNRTKIAEFAEGNSRVAIALARTVEARDSLADLNDTQLFVRLFWQGRAVDQSLLDAARAASLVYSFDIETAGGEISRIAKLADMSDQALYRKISELERRGLVQKRSIWRAVLPHAIANKLAIEALADIQPALVEAELTRDRGRLFRSFSRRLGYLHKSSTAKAIFKRWLGSGGPLENLADLPDELMAVVANLAPLDTAATLDAIANAATELGKKALEREHHQLKDQIVRLLRSIAYDAKHFERCVGVMLGIAMHEPINNNTNSARNTLVSLFQPYLSGTHATLEQRSEWVSRALLSTDEKVSGIGLSCLNAALEAHWISSYHSFDFGAHSRDYGAHPRGAAASKWFTTFIEIAAQIGSGPSPESISVREVLAKKFRTLWTIVKSRDALENAAKQLKATGWPHGWLAAKSTIKFDGKSMTAPDLRRLQGLEQQLRPNSLVEKVKAIVLNDTFNGIDIAEDAEDADDASAVASYNKANELARSLGEQVAVDEKTLDELLPSLVENRNGRQGLFGVGLAAASKNPEATWDRVVLAYVAKQADQRSVTMLRGFLDGLKGRDAPLFEKIMDSTLDHPSLAPWMPVLQLSSDLDAQGVERLCKGLERSDIPLHTYKQLIYGGVTKKLTDDQLIKILAVLADRTEGAEIAVEVLSMHIFNNSTIFSAKLTRFAQRLVGRIGPKSDVHRLDSSLESLISRFLAGPDGLPTSRKLLKKIKIEIDKYRLTRHDASGTLRALFKVQPIAALDELVDGLDDRHAMRLYELQDTEGANVLSLVPVPTLVAWCKSGKTKRWEYVARVMPLFSAKNENEPVQLSATACGLVVAAPAKSEVLKIISERFVPNSYSGYLSDTVERRLTVLNDLEALVGTAHIAEVQAMRSKFEEVVRRERSYEEDRNKRTAESFEW